jgi:glucosamine-phosphate N-acetyltransferase
MNIRKFKREDIENGLLEVYQEVWKIDAITEEVLNRYLSTENYMVVAEDEGKIVGTATLHLQRKLIRNGGTAAFIEDVAVKESHRGKGVGKLLIEHLVHIAKNLECYKINLSCFPERVAFYERCGFKKESITMRYYIS